MELLPISNFDFWVVGCVVGGLAALVDGWGVKIQTPPPPLDGSLKHENSNTRTLGWRAGSDGLGRALELIR